MPVLGSLFGQMQQGEFSSFSRQGHYGSDKFIDNVVAVLTSGVKKMMADDFDRSQYQNKRSTMGVICDFKKCSHSNN
jgi:hypothetical protein